MYNVEELIKKAHEVGMKRVLEEIETAMIKLAIERTQFNCRRAAELLNVKRTSLVEKKKRYKITTPSDEIIDDGTHFSIPFEGTLE